MRAVVDTNVILVANLDHDDVSQDCVEACVEALNEVQSSGVVVIDDQYLILEEYQHKTNSQSPKGVGDAFLKWLLQNQANPARVVRVPVTSLADDRFDEFPNNDLQDHFDPPDRKFVAVAAADDGCAPILQAADCKWLDWWHTLEQHGVKVRFLCPDDVCRFYAKKFPENKLPELPIK
ncbi:hypothetical protein [Marinobacter sp.]|uniref:hypothetical protein n=1 Tax=Marinobacter sp. TaxID=50741 RepID=UPI0019C212AF|nr:hypothetical protein [Marinobacter sp.]MBC7190763.1 hypothetical protein [Marinobacter sp.]